MLLSPLIAAAAYETLPADETIFEDDAKVFSGASVDPRAEAGGESVVEGGFCWFADELEVEGEANVFVRRLKGEDDEVEDSVESVDAEDIRRDRLSFGTQSPLVLPARLTAAGAGGFGEDQSASVVALLLLLDDQSEAAFETFAIRLTAAWMCRGSNTFSFEWFMLTCLLMLPTSAVR